MVPIGGGSTKYVLTDRWIVYTKGRKQLLQRNNLLYDTGCTWTDKNFTDHGPILNAQY